MKLGSRLCSSLGLQLAAAFDLVFLNGQSHIFESSEVSLTPLTSFSTVLMSLCMPGKCLTSFGCAQSFTRSVESGKPF